MTAKKVTKHTKTKTSDQIFGEIVGGLADAISIAKGEADPKTFRAHVPDAVDVRAVRKRVGLSQDAFANRYGFTAAAVRDWEQHRRTPDRSTRAYLKVIEKKPEAVQEALGA